MKHAALLIVASLLCTAGGRAQELARGVGWDGFPAFVWRMQYGWKECPQALLEPFGGTNVEGDEAAEWVLERGLDFYVGHAPGREELYLEREREWYDVLWKGYYEERDASLLVREPCLSEPATLEALADRLAQSLAARGVANGLAISLGDEVGLTPWGDPFDLCASAACRANWLRWLPDELKRLKVGLEATEIPYPSTDDARRAWIDGDTSLLGPWLARRRFHHEVVHALLRSLAQRARALSPETPLGLMGLSGRTAFGGVGVDAAFGFLDFVEPYSTGDARELAYTLRGADQRVLRTIFPDEGSLHGAAWKTWEHFLRGGDGVVIWSDGDLERAPAWHARLGRAVLDVRAARSMLERWRPAPAGVALLHSADSLALSWLRESLADGPTWPRRFAGYHEEHGARERSLRAWLRLCEEAGFLPGSVPIETLGAATAARFPLLIASHVWVVGEAEEARLQAYLAAGGTLLVHATFARFDGFGPAREVDTLQRLMENAEGRVERIPKDFRLRFEEDANLDAPGASESWPELRRWLHERAKAAGASAPPCELAAEGWTRGWLRAMQPDGDDWLLVALPNVWRRDDQTDAQGLLRDLELRAHPAENWRVEWLHPEASADRVLLPAGDAALLRLVRPK